MKKRCMSLLLALLLALSLAGTASAAGDKLKTVSEVRLELNTPTCGQDPQEEGPRIFLEDEDAMEKGEPCVWVTAYDKNDPAKYTALTEKLVGGQTYTALVTLRAKEGYCFDESTKVFVYDAEKGAEENDYYIPVTPVSRDSDSMALILERTAEHDWDWENMDYTAPTCVSEGARHSVCKANPAHVEDETISKDPDAHQWGDWSVTKEATKKAEGERVHTCVLCKKEETEAIPKVTLPYSKVYEPKTSWPMAATVAWRADSTALTVAKAGVRPATVFVWLDKDLKVYDREGGLLSESLDAYIDATASGVIPALYIRDEATAKALKAWLPSSGLLDCFVVSTPENKALVKDVADLLHIRGMLDYTAVKAPDRKALLDMVASTNGAHGKVILLSAEAATRENVRKLQSLASTVWAQAPADTKTLATLYTSGVNGVVTDDYQAALKTEELFWDDAPSLLRLPIIIGHRGDPSSYVENTLDSARGAAREGVDSVENDIQLSKDGQLFILHDNSPQRLLGIKRVDDAEDLTLAELREHPFLWEDIISDNEVPAERSRTGTLYGQEEKKEYTVPTLEEYIKEFKGTGLVHDTEIKSYNPDILPVYKAMVDKYDAWDQFFTITFNVDILNAMYRDYPELSTGALGFGGWTEVAYEEYEEITEAEGAEAALKSLYGTIDRWNATYNPYYYQYGEDMVRAGRHRGLTLWPWTYTADEKFAQDYLAGVTGLTCDYPWIASDYIVEITSADGAASSASALPKPQGVTRVGEKKVLPSAEPVSLEKLSETQSLMVWRYKADMNVNGESYGSYYLYSAPFVFTQTASGSQTEPGFTDVPADAYYADAVQWAVEKGITQGVSAARFAPNAPCTRAQMVTFLWRAAGQPAPAGGTNPFYDVKEDSYYADAVQWAVEQGITQGTGKTLFSPDATVSRAQSITFLYRFAGEKGDGTNPFTDVSAKDYYNDAVTWAAGEGVTAGKSATRFAPKDDCTRGQIVTFLYRALGQE